MKIRQEGVPGGGTMVGHMKVYHTSHDLSQDLIATTLPLRDGGLHSTADFHSNTAHTRSGMEAARTMLSLMRGRRRGAAC